MHVSPSGVMYAFIFFSTLSSYNFYWLLSKYSFGKPKSLRAFTAQNRSYILLSAVAATGMLISLYYIPGVLLFVVCGVLFTVFYSLPLWPFSWAVYLRKAGVFKPMLLAFTWSWVTVLIPAVSVLHKQTMAVIMLMIARFFFVGMLCIIFDSRDATVDKIYGLRSLSTDIRPGALKIIMIACFVIYMMAGWILRWQLYSISQLWAFTITGCAVALVYIQSLKKQGYIFYYFVVDGLMLFSAAATFIATLF